jgi:hypothetical protein
MSLYDIISYSCIYLLLIELLIPFIMLIKFFRLFAINYYPASSITMYKYNVKNLLKEDL